MSSSWTCEKCLKLSHKTSWKDMDLMDGQTVDKEFAIWWSQRVAINASMSKWKSVISGALQGFALGPVLFINFVSDIDCGADCSLSMFADNIKLCGAVNTVERRANIQRALGSTLFFNLDYECDFKT